MNETLRLDVNHKPGVRPGPTRGRLPDPPPAGVLPPEDSRLWRFSTKAVQQGERFIRDDTRDWFEAHDRKVVICRSYPDHPRWDLTNSRRGGLNNENIVSEIHMLARLNAGLPEVPAWVPVVMTVKQQQADLAYRLDRALVTVMRGPDLIGSLKELLARAPGSFFKLVHERTKAEAIPQGPGQVEDPEILNALAAKLREELERRARAERDIRDHSPGAFPDTPDAVETVRAVALELHEASAPRPGDEVGAGRKVNMDLPARLDRVVDVGAVIEGTAVVVEEWD